MTRFDLAANPFFLLRASPNDDHLQLVARFEAALDEPEADEMPLSTALRALLLPLPRLSAELRWLGSSPGALALAEALVQGSSVEPTGHSTPLARANAAAHLCATESLGAERRGMMLTMLVAAHAELDPAAIAEAINAAREPAGVPPADESMVDKALDLLCVEHRDNALVALMGVPQPSVALHRLVCLHAGSEPASRLVGELVEAFDTATLPELSAARDAVGAALDRLRLSPAFADAHLDALDAALSAWTALARPRQALMARLLRDDTRSFELGSALRDMALRYEEERGDTLTAGRLIRAARLACGELPGLTARLLADEERLAGALSGRGEPAINIAAAPSPARVAATRAGFSLPSLLRPEERVVPPLGPRRSAPYWPAVIALWLRQALEPRRLGRAALMVCVGLAAFVAVVVTYGPRPNGTSRETRPDPEQAAPATRAVETVSPAADHHLDRSFCILERERVDALAKLASQRTTPADVRDLEERRRRWNERCATQMPGEPSRTGMRPQEGGTREMRAASAERGR